MDVVTFVLSCAALQVRFFYVVDEVDIYKGFYSKSNKMHNVSNLFYCGTTLHMFRTVSPSIISSLRLYIQHQL